MNFFKYIVCITITFAASTNATEKINENHHLCKETVTRFSEDGGLFHEDVLVCCPGYIIDSTDKCMPICRRPCIYGFCKAPNVCECKEGYRMETNECVPICKNKCLNGYCSKPDVCGCRSGFELDAKNVTHCIPSCNPKCGNYSKCIKSLPPFPNRCQCIEGYFENKQTKICKPYCKKKCHNGFCMAPETCGCMSGYELDYANNTNCIPKCEQICEIHSSCIAPNICACDDGYKLNKINKKCEPICKDQVKYSRCIKPPNTWTCVENYQHDRKIDKCVLESCLCNTYGYCLEDKDKCVCYEGFTKNTTTGQCEPKCQPVCENSVCVANNVCQCLDEHHQTSRSHICEYNDLCDGRPCKNGECRISGECKCKEGYVKSFSYKGQIQCDTVQTFVGKVMIVFLGLPMLLASCVLIAVYIMAKKKSYNLEEQELILVNRN